MQILERIDTFASPLPKALRCWMKCQEKPNDIPYGKTQTERRRCIDGDLEDQNEEPMWTTSNENDPPSELEDAQSVPHLIAMYMIFEMTTPLAAKAQRVN